MIQIIFMIGSGINMYLIPKNIKTKREIFKGYGIIEIIAMAISLGLGYLLQMLSTSFKVKIFLFCNAFERRLIRGMKFLRRALAKAFSSAPIFSIKFTWPIEAEPL